MNTFKLIAATLITTGFAHFASAAVIDFEDYNAGTIIDNEYEDTLGVTINGVNVAKRRSNLAVVFDTDNPTGGDYDLGAPFFNNADLGMLSPGNVLIIHENPRSCYYQLFCFNPDDEGSRPAGYFDIDFGDAVTLNSIDFFDIETEENGNTMNNLISLFDINGDEIFPNTFHTPGTGGDNMWARLDFDVVGVTSMRIKLHGSGAIDNINFSRVPEPPTLLLLIAGILGLGFIRNRSKS